MTTETEPTTPAEFRPPLSKEQYLSQLAVEDRDNLMTVLNFLDRVVNQELTGRRVKVKAFGSMAVPGDLRPLEPNDIDLAVVSEGEFSDHQRMMFSIAFYNEYYKVLRDRFDLEFVDTYADHTVQLKPKEGKPIDIVFLLGHTGDLIDFSESEVALIILHDQEMRRDQFEQAKDEDMKNNTNKDLDEELTRELGAVYTVDLN